MAEYHLWSPWNSLDTSLQWLRRANPKPPMYPFRSAPNSILNLEVEAQPTFQEQFLDLNNTPMKPRCISRLASTSIDLKSIRNKKKIIKPQPVLLRSTDIVFGNMVTIQPPKWNGSLQVSDESAFSMVISHNCVSPSE
ncbi:FANCD2 opposite strand protein [Pelodytes ibericus]